MLKKALALDLYKVDKMNRSSKKVENHFLRTMEINSWVTLGFYICRPLLDKKSRGRVYWLKRFLIP